jgi:GH25 family lysozyme M1 (1,4-beta-N-acetylmuramidase)
MRGKVRRKVLAAVMLAAGVGAMGAVLGAPGITGRAMASPQSSGAAQAHYNVGAPHSPQLLRQLAGPSGRSGRGARVSSRTARRAVQGVDVAAFQHPRGRAINWHKVHAARIQFAAIKATEGNYYVNPYYARDLARASAAGLTAMAYGFANPRPHAGNGTAAGQARYLVRHAGKLHGRTPPLMLDAEYNPYQGGECYHLSKAAMVAWLKQFDAQIRKQTGQLPIIYTTADWWRRCTGGSKAFGTSLVWPAAWTTASHPWLPRGWRNWALWQYSSTGTVSGIPGSTTDLDALNLIKPGRQQAAVGRRVSVPVSQVVRRAVTGLGYAAAGLPTGLAVQVGGVISGTPTAPAGAKSSTVTASAEGKQLGSVGVNWKVATSTGH